MHDKEHKLKLTSDFRHEIDAIRTQSMSDLLNKLVPPPPGHLPEAPFYSKHRVFRVGIVVESLGDAMHRLPLIERFYRTFAPMEIDFFARRKKFGRVEIANAAFHFIRRVLDDSHLYDLRTRGYYDLVIVMKAYPVKYWIQPRSLQRLIEEKPALLRVINEAEQRFSPFKFAAHFYPHMHGLQNKMIAEMGMTVLDASGYFANIDVDRTSIPSFCPDPKALDALERFGLAGKRYITIHDGFDPDMADSGEIPMGQRMTRSWPLEYWGEFVCLFKKKYPNVLVVQVGVSKSAGRIAHVDVDLLDKTSLPESCWIIKNGLMFIDTETGMTPVAWATYVPAISMQGPTGAGYYSYPQTTTILSDFCHGCCWVKPDWSVNCARGFERAECMYAIKPQMVLETTTQILDKITPRRYEIADCSSDEEAFGIHAATLDKMLHDIGLESVPASGEARANESGIHYSDSQRQFYLHILARVSEKAAKGQSLKIVDLEGHHGALATCLARSGHDVTVVSRNYYEDKEDPNAEAQYLAWAGKNGLDLRFGSIYNAPVASASSDIVLCPRDFKTLPHQEYALQDALRLLKPEGLLILPFAPENDLLRKCGVEAKIATVKNADLIALIIRVV